MIGKLGIIGLALMLSACDDDRTAPPVKRTEMSGVYITCLNGHEYYGLRHGMANRLNDDGTPYKCDSESDLDRR